VSRIARGLPVGGELEHVDSGTLAQAVHERRVVSDDIKEDTATVPNQHDLSRFRLIIKFGLRNETGIAQDFP